MSGRPSDRSAALFRRAVGLLPGGVDSPVRAFGGVGGTPVFFESGAGARVRDAAGNEYVDYLGSWGPLIVGHCHPRVVAAIRDQAGRGTSFGAPSELETELAKRVCARVPACEKVRFVSSGTEATMSAVRLARGATGRDRVVKVDGVAVSTWEEMRKLINKRPDEKVELEFERAGQRYTAAVRTIAQKDEETGELIGVIGVTLPTVTVTMPPGEAIQPGFLQTLHTVGITYRGFADLVSSPQQAARQVAGPITIAQIAGSSAQRGSGRLLYFIAFISVALMALNLLPIPVLDGGHAFFFLIEGLRGRRLSDRSQLMFQKVGLVLIGGLIVFSVANDAIRQFERARGRQELDRQAPASQSP